jgi:hypothetical protein
MTDKELAEAARLFKAVRWSEIEALMSKVQSEVDDLEMPDLSRDTKTYLMQVKPILKERYNHVTEVIAGLKA